MPHILDRNTFDSGGFLRPVTMYLNMSMFTKTRSYRPNFPSWSENSKKEPGSIGQMGVYYKIRYYFQVYAVFVFL